MTSQSQKNNAQTAHCLVCDEEFLQYRSSQKFCGKSCKNKHHYEKRAEAWRRANKGE